MVEMISGLDGSWDEPCVAAEFLWMRESVYLSYLGQNNHGTVITDSRDAGEQHRLLVVFAEGFNFLCGLCFFMNQCLNNVRITGEAVLFRIRECEIPEEFHSSWVE